MHFDRVAVRRSTCQVTSGRPRKLPRGDIVLRRYAWRRISAGRTALRAETRKEGTKERQGAADPTGPARDAGTEPSVQETAASAQEYSEHDSSQCPDEFSDSEDEEDELDDASSACQLG